MWNKGKYGRCGYFLMCCTLFAHTFWLDLAQLFACSLWLFFLYEFRHLIKELVGHLTWQTRTEKKKKYLLPSENGTWFADCTELLFCEIEKKGRPLSYWLVCGSMLFTFSSTRTEPPRIIINFLLAGAEDIISNGTKTQLGHIVVLWLWHMNGFFEWFLFLFYQR